MNTLKPNKILKLEVVHAFVDYTEHFSICILHERLPKIGNGANAQPCEERGKYRWRVKLHFICSIQN